MGEMLSEEEIQELLEQIQKETLKPSIIEIKPIEIKKIKDVEKREKLLEQFINVNDLYVCPLERVLKYISKNNNYSFSYDLTNLSIMERIKLLEKMLLNSGYTSSQIIDLVPKSEQEINIIMSAKKNGFNDNIIFNNHSRILAAKHHLEYVKSLTNSILKKTKRKNKKSTL